MNSMVALYGDVAIRRVYCYDCHCWTFIRKGVKVCCGMYENESPSIYKRIVEPEYQRRLPSPAERKKILEWQANKCLYCGQEFGNTQHRHGLPVKLKLVWDHKLPYAYSANNSVSNFAACCHVCNGIKSSLIFQTVIEASVYIESVRRTKGYDF